MPYCCRDFSVEIHCGSLETPPNGNKIGSNDIVDSVMVFSCDNGFRLSGSAQRNCTDVGEWTGVDIMCIGKLIPSIEIVLIIKHSLQSNFVLVTTFLLYTNYVHLFLF